MTGPRLPWIQNNTNNMSAQTAAFLRLMRHPVKFPLFLLAKLPAAFFAGVRVKYIDEQSCKVTVPYKWLSQNPFHSTYFACLSMAGEMSTGALGMAYTYKSNPPISMLVVRVDSEYFKKATGKTEFSCEDGALIHKTIEEAIATGEGKTIRTKSIGRNKVGDVVAEIYVTWSFKAKNKRVR